MSEFVTMSATVEREGAPVPELLRHADVVSVPVLRVERSAARHQGPDHAERLATRNGANKKSVPLRSGSGPYAHTDNDAAKFVHPSVPDSNQVGSALRGLIGTTASGIGHNGGPALEEGVTLGGASVAGAALGVAVGMVVPSTALNVGESLAVAQAFYSQTGWPSERIASHLAGIDFSHPANVTILPQGTAVVQYQIPGNPVGNYFAPAGTAPDTLGINPAGRVAVRYVTTRDVTVLRSTAASTAGNADLPASMRGGGGGTQFFAPNTLGFAPVP